MNFLALCQSVHRWLRAGNALPGTAPLTVSPTDVLEDEIVHFVRTAWNDIQVEQDEWRFMSSRGSFLTTAGDRTYTPTNIRALITDYDAHLPLWQGARCILLQHESVGVADQSRCYFMPYERWRGERDYGVRSQGRPSFYTVWPDQTIEFDPTPEAIYRVELDYRRQIQALTATGDEPTMPARYHDAIVWRAVKYYCITRQNNDQLYQMADREFGRLFAKMCRTELPEPYLDTSWG